MLDYGVDQLRELDTHKIHPYIGLALFLRKSKLPSKLFVKNCCSQLVAARVYHALFERFTTKDRLYSLQQMIRKATFCDTFRAVGKYVYCIHDLDLKSVQYNVDSFLTSSSGDSINAGPVVTMGLVPSSDEEEEVAAEVAEPEPQLQPQPQQPQLTPRSCSSFYFPSDRPKGFRDVSEVMPVRATEQAKTAAS